jgi:hypothetical protein
LQEVLILISEELLAKLEIQTNLRTVSPSVSFAFDRGLKIMKIPDGAVGALDYQFLI